MEREVDRLESPGAADGVDMDEVDRRGCQRVSFSVRRPGIDCYGKNQKQGLTLRRQPCKKTKFVMRSIHTGTHRQLEMRPRNMKSTQTMPSVNTLSRVNESSVE